MTCKNCIYEPMCHNVIAYGMDTDDITGKLITDIEKHCKHFKDKSRVIIPPCKVGDTVYVLYPQIKYIEKYYVTGIILGDKNDTIQFKYGAVFTIWEKKYDEYFGKTIFFTREEAEKARAERGGTNADS